MKNKQLLLATRNRHKQKELQTMLALEGIEVLTLDDVLPVSPITEDGLTFEDNAYKKACLTARQSGCISMADDSGLMVEFLDGQPGVYSARFAGEGASDAENNAKLLKLLEGVKPEDRKAKFVCAIALCHPSGKKVTVEAHCEGQITMEPRGNLGFGYDPLFMPNGFQQTFAEIAETEKNSISHRALALKKITPYITNFYIK